MAYRQEVLLTGAGGQGLILASIILGDAAIQDGKNVVQTQSYGPEARGGESMAGVIVDIDPIDFPNVTRPNILLSLNQKSFYKFAPRADSDCLIIVDSTFVDDVQNRSVYSYPITRETIRVIGREVVANIVALSIVNQVSGLLDQEALKNSVLARAPKGTGEMNVKALELGEELVRQGSDEENSSRLNAS